MGASDALIAIDELDDLLHNAKLVPLSDRVRVDPDEVADVVRRIRSHCEMSGLPAPGIRAALDGLEEALRAAKPMRFLRGVSVDKDRVYELLDALRAQIPEELRRDG